MTIQNFALNYSGVAEVNNPCLGYGICTHICPQDALPLRIIRLEDYFPA